MRRRLLLLLALAAASPRLAMADDDAGTRSVFAQGAGNRALALGGAFTAIADDASAALWNPGGLGWVERAEAQFAQSSLELDFRETFAGVVLPDWRWGTAAITLRHFGTSGIEGRDDRNTLVNPGLSSGESEIALGYGRALGQAWSLGGSLKFRRQELAGRAGSAVGADLGVRLLPGVALGLETPWARAVHLGLSLQNVVEPAIRLDQESVPDPSAMRLGLAVAPPFAGAFGLLASFDVEKARDVSPRLHAGLELKPHPLLALRAGLDRGALTAGTGVRFRNAELAYAFEDQAVGPTHRAGLGFRFGVAAPEARARAAREEEERFAARLAEIEGRRDAERLDDLLARAEQARARGDLDEALSLAATARAIDPADPRGAALGARALGDRGRTLLAAGDPAGAAVAFRQALALAPADTALAAALEKSRAESDARAARSAEIRRQFSLALDAFAADQLATARAGFAAILAVNPGDAEARTMLDRVDRAIAQRAELERRRAAAAPPARPVAPRPAPAPAAAAPAPPTPQQERELASLYRRGVTAFEAGRSDEALRYWELVWSLRPGYQKVNELLEREYLTRGMDHFAAGRLVEAIATWERALQVVPKSPRALAYLARAQEQLERAREIGEERP